jgi:hypothetical protein
MLGVRLWFLYILLVGNNFKNDVKIKKVFRWMYDLRYIETWNIELLELIALEI